MEIWAETVTAAAVTNQLTVAYLKQSGNLPLMSFAATATFTVPLFLQVIVAEIASDI